MRYADTRCVYVEQYIPKHVYIFTGKCMVTGKMHSVMVPAEELYAYRQGAAIQYAMPSVSSEDCEFLMNGISPEGWKQMDEDEEGDSDILDL